MNCSDKTEAKLLGVVRLNSDGVFLQELCSSCKILTWSQSFNSGEIYLCYACRKNFEFLYFGETPIDFDESNWELYHSPYYRSKSTDPLRIKRLDKTTPTMIPPNDYHVRIDVWGPAANREVFFAMCFVVDPDFPISPTRKTNESIPICSKCKGVIWSSPMLNTRELKRAAKQCNVQIKIRRYAVGTACGSHNIESRIY